VDLIANSMLRIGLLLCFAVDSAPYFIDKKIEVPRGKLQDHLISGNDRNRTSFNSVAHAAFYTAYPTQGQ